MEKTQQSIWKRRAVQKVLVREELLKNNFHWEKFANSEHKFRRVQEEINKISIPRVLRSKRHGEELKEVGEEKKERINLEKFIKSYSFEVFPHRCSFGVKIAKKK